MLEFTSITPEEAELYIMNSVNQRVRERIANIIIDGTVLDVGCANGIDAHRYTPEQYTGIDISSELIKVAQKRNPDYLFICINAIEYLKNCKRYDFIICKAVLEHIPLWMAIELYDLMVKKCDVLLLAWHMIPKDKTEIHHVIGHFGKDVLQNEYDFKLFDKYNITKEEVDNYELWRVS